MSALCRWRALLPLLILVVVAWTVAANGGEARTLQLPEGDTRTCPFGKPYSIEGSFRHQNRDNQYEGSDRFYINLIDDDSQPPVVIDEQVTGSDGSFKLCFGDSDLQTIPDFFVIKIRSAFALDPVSQQSPPVLQVLGRDAPEDFGDADWFWTVFYGPIELGQNQYVFENPLLVPDGIDHETAFRIKDDLQAGYDLVNGETGSIESEWPHNDSIPGVGDLRSYFCYGNVPDMVVCSEPRVYITRDDGEQVPDTVVHEMGHHVMYNRYNGNMPAPSTDYWFFSFDSWQPGPCENHFPGSEIPGERDCIWQEDWANFWAVAVKNDPNYLSWNLEDGGPGWPGGDATEGRVAGALWDMYDAVPDGTDAFASGIYTIWDVFFGLDVDFEEYWQHWKNYGAHQCAATSIYQNTIEYNADGWVDCAAATPVLAGGWTESKIGGLGVGAQQLQTTSGRSHFF